MPELGSQRWMFSDGPKCHAKPRKITAPGTTICYNYRTTKGVFGKKLHYTEAEYSQHEKAVESRTWRHHQPLSEHVARSLMKTMSLALEDPLTLALLKSQVPTQRVRDPQLGKFVRFMPLEGGRPEEALWIQDRKGYKHHVAILDTGVKKELFNPSAQREFRTLVAVPRALIWGITQ